MRAESHSQSSWFHQVFCSMDRLGATQTQNLQKTISGKFSDRGNCLPLGRSTPGLMPLGKVGG